MPNNKRFRVTDESVNSHGFRVMTAGIDMTDFLKNPVGYHNHDYDAGVIIRWEGIKLEGDTITAIPIFDETDPLGLKIHKKVEGDFVRTCSMALEPIEFSDDPKYKLTGQTKPTLIKSKLVEISTTDISSNKNALAQVALMHEGKLLNLADEKVLVQLMGFSKTDEKLKNKNTMKNLILLATTLGITLAADATEEQASQLILNSITKIKEEKEALKLKADAADVKLAEEHKAKCLQLIDTAVKDKKIALADKPNWLKTAEGNYDTTKLMLEGLKPVLKLSDIPGSKGQGAAPDATDRSTWTFSDWKKKDGKGLLKLKADNHEEYQRLFETDPKNAGIVIA